MLQIQKTRDFLYKSNFRLLLKFICKSPKYLQPSTTNQSISLQWIMLGKLG